jgi:hypothetical protein
VLWGSNVSQVGKSMRDYLPRLIKSAWMAWLCEYNTLGQPKPTTNQELGFGNFVGQKTIVPFNKKKRLTDLEIQKELKMQLAAGNLPLPKVDAEGQILTLYMIEFPANISIVNGCCGYHNNIQFRGKPLLYSVLPDLSPRGTCFVEGCGSGTVLQNSQNVHAHELAEAVTDPENGWFDDVTGNEIGDICDLQEAQINAGGTKITVQKLWSNRLNKCIATNPNLAKGPVVTGPKCATIGKTAQLKATGAKGPFQWYHNGVLVPNATTAVLTIKNAKKSDAGNYFARGSCTRASNTFVLKVK